MTTPSGMSPPGSEPNAGTWNDTKNKDQADWEAERTADWNDAAGGVLGGFGSMIQALPMQVVVLMLTMLGDLLSNVPIVGDTLEDIVDNIAAGLNDTHSTAVTAQTTANNAIGAFVSLEEEVLQSGAVLGNHENRIIRLESGNIVEEFFSNDVWSKPLTVPDTDPALPYHHHECIGIAGGGGGRRSANSNGAPRGGSWGGGQGGFASQSFLNSAIGNSVTVVIGVGGAGATDNGTNGSPGTATTFTDAGGSLLVCGAGPGGTINAPITGSGTHPEWAANGGKGCTIVSNTDVEPGTNGGNGYLAAGGQGADTAGENGGNGGACPAGRIGPGGGGGGGYHNDPSFNGGNGGHGGFPGGAGGATGPNGSTGFFVGPSPDYGGNGAPGRALIVSYVGA